MWVEITVLDDIETQYKEVYDVKAHFVEAWINVDAAADWEKLIAKLKEINHCSLAQNLEISVVSRSVREATDSSGLQPMPSLESSSTSEDEGRVRQVKEKIEIFKREYSRLVMEATNQLTTMQTNDQLFLDRFVMYILALPVSKKAVHIKLFEVHERDIVDAVSVRSIFAILIRYSDYDNYEIMLSIVEVYFKNGLYTDFRSYQESFTEFEKDTSVEMYLKAISALPQGQLCLDFTKMTLKLNKTPSICNLYEVRQLKEAIAQEASLPSYSVYLESVQVGSVNIVLRIQPKAVSSIEAVMSANFQKKYNLTDVVIDGRAIHECYVEETLDAPVNAHVKSGSEFGQVLPGGQIFKEIVQNADDAGAKNVTFYLDNRSHGTKSLIAPRLNKYYEGPALLAFNDAKFTATDWDSIQKPEQSGKEKDPFKVGKFGLGFNSVYHITDLPTLISGPTIGFMEPRGWVWRKESGRKFAITLTELRQTLAPFDGIGEFCSGMATYPHTLFRFPLRLTPSDLSERCYDIGMLKELLEALKEESDFLLVFLRSVVCVRVIEINEAGEQSTLFEVSIDSSDRDMVSQKRQSFSRELKNSCLKQRKSGYRKLYNAKFSTRTVDAISGESREKRWLVTATVGSEEPRDLQAANKLKVLPWVGCALELDREIPDDSGGRLFCFLPLPHETRSPLPVHVNGTFGLEDNRRSIKWPSKEGKHDSTASWNNTIVCSLLPYCYALLIRKAIEEGIPPGYVYDSWPRCEKLRHTPWSGLMHPLFDILFSPDTPALWSVESPTDADKGKWITFQCATIITDLNLSPELHKVLSVCGLKLVDLSHHPQITEALRVHNKKPIELSPSLVRQAVRSKKGLEYKGMLTTTKHELLQYCLLDCKYNELEGLELLPRADGTFVSFTQISGENTCYVSSDRCKSGLLPGLQHQLVDLTSECPTLHLELLKVSASGKTQLRKLTPEDVAKLLSHAMPPEWKKLKFAPIQGSVFSWDWFRMFWEWVAHNNLDLFEGKMVLPVVKQCSKQDKVYLARLTKKSSVVFMSDDSLVYADKPLMHGLEKLNVYFTGPLVFAYLQYCKSLREYVYSATPNDILSALRNAYSDNEVNDLDRVKLTKEQAEAIQKFIPDLQQSDTIVKHLPIFSVQNSSSLVSLSTAVKKSWGGRAVMITTPSSSGFEENADYLPSDLLLLTATYHQKKLVNIYRDMVDSLHWIDLVLRYLFPMIQSSSYPASKLLLLMEELLEQLSSPKLHARSKLVDQMKAIPFLKKDSKSGLFPPSKMFDPSVPILKDIVPPAMFPKEPFNKPSLLPQLRECGLRQALTAQEVFKVIISIGSKKGSATEVSRSKAILEYLDGNKYLTAENVIQDGRQVELKKAILEYSKKNKWLPGEVEPPENYPCCLPWKGKSHSALVSLGSETLVCSPKYFERDYIKVGSAVCIVICPLSVAAFLGSALKVEPVVQHLKKVIECHPKMDQSAVDSVMLSIYEYFHKRTESYSTLKSTLPKSWIWIKNASKFVSTKSLCLKRRTGLQQDLEPFVYILPESLQKFTEFFKAMGVKESVTDTQLLRVLASIKETTDASQENSEELWMSVMSILTILTLHGKQHIKLQPKETLYVPINSESLHLEDSSKVCYADYDFLQEFLNSTETPEDEEKCIICHDEIRHIAPQLHLEALSSHYELAEDLFNDFGPHEPLVQRLKNILRDYKDGLTIIKELIQNADDAGATEINFCYDSREHSVNPKTLLYSGMSECCGPALIVHNDAKFTDEDFQNITKLAAATKQNKPLKIGKFGIGFCSVYHITDVPSFVSREYLYIFDPTLQYLKQHISDTSRPGKRLNFTKRIATHSNQLAPFVGLFNFKPKQAFDGTMFRFPFRTSRSELSTIQYTQDNIEQLREDIEECGAKLLLFLQNVSRITFSCIDEGDKSPRLLLDIQKEYLLPLLNEVQSPLPQVSEAQSPLDPLNEAQTALPLIYEAQLVKVCTHVQDTQATSHWIVSSHVEDMEFGGQETKGTSSIAAQLSLPIHSDKSTPYVVEQVKGEVFCFLPLGVLSGLPVHISANFAVQNDRSGIRTSKNYSSDAKDANEAEWNVDLMKSIIPTVYMKLLLTLSQIHADNQQISGSYKCHTLMPLKEHLTAHNPWDFLIAPFYNFTIVEKLLFSECTKSWLTISEGIFLQSDILSSGQTNNEVVQACVKILNLSVIDIPDKYESHLPPHNTLQEIDFVELFFNRIDELEHHIEIRNTILNLILQSYYQKQQYHKRSLRCIIEQHECIPCTPDGQVLRYCNDVIDPDAYFSELYDPEDGVFPVGEFLTFPTNQALIELGMIHETLDPDKVVERARTIETLYSTDPQRALKQTKLIFNCLSNSSSDEEYIQLSSIKFIPVQPRPKDYPEFLQWQGDGHTLMAPDEIYYGETCVMLAGSHVCCVASTEEPEEGGCGSIDQAVISKVGIETMPHLSLVVKHLLHIIDEVTARQPAQFSAEWVTRACSEVYQFLETHLRYGDSLGSTELGNCVWTGSCFVPPNMVSTEWAHNGPYLFQVPAALKDKKFLLSALDIKDHFCVQTIVETLTKLKEEYRNNPIDRKLQDFLAVLMAKLGLKLEDKENWRHLNLYLPDTNHVLKKACELNYNDADWPEDLSTNFVHSSISRKMALKLGVRPIRAKLLDEYEDTYDEDSYDEDPCEGEEFGQHEALTQRIQNILEDYPFDITVLKELLQNADDAKATKMVIMLDKRFHGVKMVPSDEWKDLQGPALLVWNDSSFSKEDIDGIQKLGLGSKRNTSETIGMYGIGFNVVYHLTDCPSFISTDENDKSILCVLDPHCRYIPGAKKDRPGRRFNELDEGFWKQWSDMGAAYLRQTVGLSDDIKKVGSLFRFPLRYKQDLVSTSELAVMGSTPLEADIMEEYLMDWAPQMRETLFFLNNVTELQFIVINDDDSIMVTHHYKVEVSAEGQICRNRIQEEIRKFSAEAPTPSLQTYTLKLTEEMNGETNDEPSQWLIQQGVGDSCKPSQHWQFLPKMKPKHGIAAPLSPQEETDMKVFCFLPLPIKSHLPVHINGSFVLHSSRRQLWEPTNRLDDKAQWNKTLMEAIASSYVHLLEKFKRNFIPQSVTERELLLDHVKHFYKLFPTWLPQCGSIPEGECYNLAQLVYRKIYEKNSHILIHLGEREENGDCTVEFLPPLNSQKPSKQPYFYDRDQQESLNIILRKIGMHLTEAPASVYDHFASLRVILPEITRESVFEFYGRFNCKVFSSGFVTPEPITITMFGSVENFEQFTKYLLEYYGDGSSLEFPESPLGVPLLLTADGNLRKFDYDDKAIRSEYSNLFTNRKEIFLHPQLMEIKYNTEYFLEPGSEHWKIVWDIMSSTLPPELECETILMSQSSLTSDSLRQLWQCFSKEEFFLVHLENILKTWALIPSKAGELFSFKCKFLPVMEDNNQQSQSMLYISNPYLSQQKNYTEIAKVLNDLQMPKVDHSVVQEILAERLCPKLSNEAAIVKNLYYLHKKRNVLVNISPEYIQLLFEYCSNIHLKKDPSSLRYIQSLPLFRNIDGELCSILDVDVYIWPDDMCREGRDVLYGSHNHVFLRKDGEWTWLGASVLGVKEITSFYLYTKLIFPAFHKLTLQQRQSHLQVIRDSLYNKAQLLENLDSEARLFIEELKKLSIIPRKDGSLHPASEFADPREKLIQIFKHHFYFPPGMLSNDEWLIFLVTIGLKTSVTQKEYLQFCYEVQAGKHDDIECASKKLTEYLFEKTEWHDEKHTYFLREVSKIAFVCAKALPDLDWIHKCSSSRTILHGKHTLHFTSLDQAADHEHHKLVWTVKPIVHLPSYPGFSYGIAKRKRKDLLQQLNVRSVTPKEVIKNIQNIASTKLSEFKSFDKYSIVVPKDGVSVLMNIIKESFEYLKAEAKDLSETLSPLKAVPCIPVCAEGNIEGVTCPVLVRPMQVIAQTTDSIKEFMPFLNCLPNEFYSILPDVLSKIGVEQSVKLMHIQDALETVHTQCGETRLDINSVTSVQTLIKKLYDLLCTQPESSDLRVFERSTLYLPNVNYVLVDSRTLVYQDSEHFKKTTLKFGGSQYSELYLLIPPMLVKLHYRFSQKDLCRSIPHEISPKPLSTSCREIMPSCLPEAPHSQQASGLRRAFKLSSLVSGAVSVLMHNSNSSDVCLKLKESLRQFFSTCEVMTVRNLKIELWLKLCQPEENIGTAHVDFHIERNSDDTFHLYLDMDARKIFFHQNLSVAIMDVACKMSNIRLKDIKEPKQVLMYLLQAETSDDIHRTLREIGAEAIEESHTSTEQTESYIIRPVLGEPIPEQLHYQLEQDYNNLFRPGEIVGYEVEEDHIVFATIGYKLMQENEDDFALYCIYLEEGEEDGKTVSVLDIYKIRRSMDEAESNIVQEVMVYEGSEEGESQPRDDPIPQNLKDIKKQICDELRKIWSISDDTTKRKALKRMYLKWHPDKNPQNPQLTEEAFKFLKRQVERLERGLPMEDPDEVEEEAGATPQPKGFSSQFWESFFRSWDNTAHSHYQYQQRHWQSDFTSTSFGGNWESDEHTFGFDIPDPTVPDKEKARRWLKQATCDFKALLFLSVTDDPDVCANICFLAHEVAEKSLKAGMLAVWGLRSVDFSSHKKMHDFAFNLEEAKPQLRGLVSCVRSLPTERFYYKTRWPNWHTEHEVPAEHFDHETAQNAKTNAKDILDLIRTVVL